MTKKPITLPLFEVGAVTNSGEVRLSMTEGRRWAAHLLAENAPVALLSYNDLLALGFRVDTKDAPARCVVTPPDVSRERCLELLVELVPSQEDEPRAHKALAERLGPDFSALLWEVEGHRKWRSSGAPSEEVIAAVRAALEAVPRGPGAVVRALREVHREHPDWSDDALWWAVQIIQGERAPTWGAL